ncbi:4Fe-4S dicluster domain-containing protein [Candidatus Nitrospira bockiana]
MASEPSYGRRHFLKDSLVSIAKTAQEYVKHRDAPAEPAAIVPRHDWLRPPGAAPETLFLARCTKCGDCLKACPHEAIQLDPRDGSPVLFPDVAPCHLCDDFPCVSACATDALRPIDGLTDVRMGLAVVATQTCTADQGCNACVSKCPTGAISMDFETMRVSVSSSNCVGCGLCEYTCKSVNDRTAITVRPARLLRIGDAPLF